jgi:hypothetical protein
MRQLRHDLTKVKCHVNEGSRECRYLAASPDGFVCGFLDSASSARLAALDRVARGGPCSDPYDDTSDALPDVPRAKPVNFARVRKGTT